MSRLRKADEVLGRVLYVLMLAFVAVSCLALLASVVLIVAGIFLPNPWPALGITGVIALPILWLLYGGRSKPLPEAWHKRECLTCGHAQASHVDGKLGCQQEVAPFYTDTTTWFDGEIIKSEHGQPCGCTGFHYRWRTS
ncbi:hypothetical protein J4573_35345 [Actinomadura barringtoniae]|uniref:Uncharacterized protein n=1 Tax=Actinomadura barringtoniae TaxID=1427535 RepID=A0A939PGU4_9ACTN|nr:hypothetical protein [Actinomadura barringtoniae]MBO2452411.1 hypothetical protein [Actinomadura barringtoniae]